MNILGRLSLLKLDFVLLPCDVPAAVPEVVGLEKKKVANKEAKECKRHALPPQMQNN